MIVGGDPISASDALKNGLIEKSSKARLRRRGFARKCWPRSARCANCARRQQLAAAKADRFDLHQRGRGDDQARTRAGSPFAAADAVGLPIDLPFDEGLKKEREGFLNWYPADQSKAQRYAFFSEREAAKVAGVPKGPNRAMSSASPSSAPAPWAAVSRCRSQRRYPGDR